MRPTDLARMHSVTNPQVHPDGQRIAFTVATPDLDDDTYVRRIHVWQPDGGAHHFTHGPKDGSPRWSPDGRHLAFLRTGTGDDDEPQLAVMPAAAGEARVLTDIALGVSDLAWSPDSTRLVVVGSEWIDEVAELDDDERARRPRRITRIPYRAEGRGFTHDRRSRMWLVDIDGDTEPRCLTPDDCNDSEPRFTHDGSAVVFVSRRRDDRETNHGEEVYTVDVASGDVTMLADSGLWSTPVPMPDGSVLLTGFDDIYAWPAPARVYRRAIDATLTDLTADVDRNIATPSGPVLVTGGFLAMVEDRGRVHVRRFAHDRTHGLVVGGDQVVTGVSASPDGEVVAYTATSLTDPGELWRVVDGEPHMLTTINADLRDSGEVLATERLSLDIDGTDIDGWLLLPSDPETPDSIPLLLNIHGGPTAQYGFGFFDEFQVYVSAGYAVLGINPRGSSGRGREWARAVVAAWTDHDSVDTRDFEAAVDAVLDRHPKLARDRLGVMGGSYGGFATTRLIARSDRFSSAVVERALLNFVSFGGTSDIGVAFDRLFLEGTLPDAVDDLWTASPMSQAHRITTPTLIIHAEQDHRCPIEQAEQLFALLRRCGVDAEFVRFPDETHELSRSGSPKHRVERFEAILDWHGRHLGVRPNGE